MEGLLLEVEIGGLLVAEGVQGVGPGLGVLALYFIGLFSHLFKVRVLHLIDILGDSEEAVLDPLALLDADFVEVGQQVLGCVGQEVLLAYCVDAHGLGGYHAVRYCSLIEVPELNAEPFSGAENSQLELGGGLGEVALVGDQVPMEQFVVVFPHPHLPSEHRKLSREDLAFAFSD